jgi:hypothetical protein
VSLDALARYARRRPRPRAAAGDLCELCAAPAGEPHAHVVDLQRRVPCCACATCARLFVQGGGAGARYRTVPDRVLVDPGFAVGAAEWSALQIPVGLAFVLFSSARGRWVALYPSPGGAIESELPQGAWRDLAARSPLVAAAEPDVEALLVHGARGAASLECLLVPIDACYALVARVRRAWRGLDGGDEVRRELAASLAGLRARARPLPRKGPTP